MKFKNKTIALGAAMNRFGRGEQGFWESEYCNRFPFHLISLERPFDCRRNNCHFVLFRSQSDKDLCIREKRDVPSIISERMDRIS
jgi:hypothetical protein